MNNREPRPTPRESLRVFRSVAVLLLPVLGVDNAQAAGRSRSSNPVRTPVAEGSVPYLLALGPPPLRFQEYVPPPEVSPRLPAGGPTTSASPATSHTSDVILPASDTDPTPAAKNEPKDNPAAPKKPGPAAIIPDDTRPQVRPEDFLPFFQIPGSGRGPVEVNVLAPIPSGVPSPAPLQPSSATYTQTPR